MRIFVTGASGWIGSAVVPELVRNGHQVLGLARSEDAAGRIAATGGEVLRGDVEDLDVLRAGARDSDGVVHLAFRHDIAFSGDFETAVASDREAIEAIGEVLAGTDRPLAIASGLAGHGSGVAITEADRPEPFGGPGGRITNERIALDLAGRGVRSMSVRFAPTVHGEGDGGFVRLIADADAAHGAAGYVGDGGNHWPAVHQSDAAALVRLGIESAPPASVLHAVGESAVEFRAIAEALGRSLGVPAQSLTEEQAGAGFGFLGAFIAMDIVASSDATRELVGWRPSGPTLLEDIEAGHYA